ncbi:hypothetical protein Nepgr_017580 [Nepenthes gracilis]|uniref:XPG-I domain-containing protein n=1 Tax=Nepenthes gracilis TaxID=150966 RepID=A0AAD3SRT9_NEPGR|nr:hypothetical protein Nepgr_017580 [Nepenthes gracilis]
MWCPFIQFTSVRGTARHSPALGTRARKENLLRAFQHESSGNSAAAYECYQKAIDISPAIAYELIQVLKKENVYYIVAPYEADAQMTFLAVTKQVDAVITEDSDLIPFGCPRIIFKMDKFGQGVEFQYHMLQQNKELNFTGFTKQMLLEMCILSGCDYLQSLPGLGIKKAHALTKKFKTFDKVIKHLRYSTMAVPPLYEQLFNKAIWTFQHQRVYDPNVEDIVHLSNVSDNIDEDLDFLGPYPTSKAIAEGVFDPISKQPFQGENAHAGPVTDSCYKSKEVGAENKKNKIELPAQKNILTNYFCFASLEAKRKFRAPRIRARQSDDGSSPSSGEQVSEVAIATKLNSSSAPPVDPINPGDAFSLIDSMDNGFSQRDNQVLDSSFDGMTESPDSECTPLQQSRHSSYKYCLALQERGNDYPLHSVIKKPRLETEDTVRSSCFQHKSKDENGSCKSHKVITSSYIQHKSDKVIVRSSYFRHKSTKENDPTNNNDEQLVNYRASCNGKYMDAIPESEVARNNFHESSNLKRRASLADNFPTEHVMIKHSKAEASIPNEGCCPSVDDTSSLVKSAEGKFGCNISHLDQYSDISEKSLEKFLSIISSFRYSSSGSRASGLRAPLRDVHNTCLNRNNLC